MSKFNLKSGNATPFKLMGSSPAKNAPEATHPEHHKKSKQTDEEFVKSAKRQKSDTISKLTQKAKSQGLSGESAKKAALAEYKRNIVQKDKKMMGSSPAKETTSTTKTRKRLLGGTRTVTKSTDKWGREKKVVERRGKGGDLKKSKTKYKKSTMGEDIHPMQELKKVTKVKKGKTTTKIKREHEKEKITQTHGKKGSESGKYVSKTKSGKEGFFGEGTRYSGGTYSRGGKSTTSRKISEEKYKASK